MKTFAEYAFKVRSYECGPDGMATLATICNYLQEVASLHAAELGFSRNDFAREGRDITWVLTRLHIKMTRFPRWMEEVTVKTFPRRGHRNLTAERDFILRAGDETLGIATSEWMVIDLVTRKLASVPQALFDRANDEDAPVMGEGAFARLRWTPRPEDGAIRLRARKGDIDINGHVNNVHYVEWLCEALPPRDKPISEFEIVFKTETFAGDEVRADAVETEPGVWLAHVAAADGRDHVVSRIRAALSLVATAFFAAVLAGCDFFNSEADRVETMKLEVQKAEIAATEKKDAAQALKAYVAGKCNLIIEAKASASNAFALVSKDVAALESAVSSAMATGGASQKAESKLLYALRDGQVNALAQKYLACGFASQTATYMARMREALEQEKAYRDAVRKVESDDVTMPDADVDVDKEADSAANRNAIRRLQKEIDEAERKLKQLRATTIPANYQRTRERDEMVGEYMRQIRLNRAELERLRDPRRSHMLQQTMSYDRVVLRDKDRSVRETALRDIDRRLKPKTTVFDVIRETEAATIGTLRETLQRKQKSAQEALSALERKETLAKGYLLEVPVCEASELRQLRLRVDKNLSLEETK